MRGTLRASMAAIIALPYRLRLARLGRRPRMRPLILLNGARRIEIGDDAYVEGFASLAAAAGGRLRIGSCCEIGAFSRLDADEGELILGDRCSVNPFSLLNGYGGLRLGDDVRVASHCVILSSTHNHDDPTVNVRAQGVSRRPTVIGDDVWIGSHVVVVGGVTIGAHSVVGAGAVVISDIPPFSVAAGVPARVIRARET